MAEFAGGGIGDIGLIYHHGAALLARAVDFQLAFLIAHHARHQRQSIVHPAGIVGKAHQFVRLEHIILIRALLHGTMVFLDVDAFSVRFRSEDEADLFVGLGGNFHLSSGCLKACRFHGNGPMAAGNFGNRPGRWFAWSGGLLVRDRSERLT